MLDLIADMRMDYKLKALLESDADANPIRQFEKWWKEAVKSEIPDVNAMTLATASADGIPSARIVLLKGFDDTGFVFFTNYESFKAQQLQENPRACLVFFWKELERQVRITGVTARIDPAMSDDYFKSRPEGSRISAIASPQSRVVESRDWLELRVDAVSREFEGKEPERPENWGGYIVRPICIEFWQGRSNRLHDRLQYTLEDNGAWEMERLAP
jgi:pyridoxamine 5'-phosphate oxidase